MTDQTEVHTEAPVTITLSIEALAKHLVPDYDSEYDETGPAPMGALDGILKHVAALLVRDIKPEYVKAAAEEARLEVHRRVAAIVEDVLAEGAVVGDGYSKTTVKPLRELIKDEVTAWTTKRVGDGYGRGGQETALQQVIRTEVDKALKADLATVLDGERETFREAIRSLAAEKIADDAARRR